ncbi:hypothetical protein H6G89_17900 [Oscillatoria sp. FACHB-1407]|uniref:hypothetical protein n=1 Tax=Oscillatoria sp. FACHB-1407 TaxID=2692847 RepID=UPI00168A3AB4|nr:hypothetical protein [Oscillatoria sp. FACHB-1407]MBD2462917.1 hypothetical protein [Oscillatoria sp. FACHB-1407]
MSAISSVRPFLSQLLNQLQTERAIVWLNGITLLAFLALTVYVRLWSSGQVVERLFGAPFYADHPYFGALTTLSNLLLCTTVAICGFSSVLLSQLHPRHKVDWFLVCSAGVIGLILLDRVFRITIILYVFEDIRKIVMFLFYGGISLIYGRVFWRRVLKTPYVLLLGTGGLLVFGAVVDMTPIPGEGTPAMLEDGSTLLATLNLMIYMWIVCKQEFIRAFNRDRL